MTDGALRPNQGSRGVGSRGRTGLHVDLTDVVSLLCVRQAPDDPHSWLASSTPVFNELLRTRPDVVPGLFEGFQWDHMGEHAEGEAPTSGCLVPLFSEAGGHISCRYNRAWIATAAGRLDQRFTPEHKEVFDLLDTVADEHRLEVPFDSGDMLFVNNYTVLHGRDAHEPVDDEQRKRLLLRIWLDLDDDDRALADEATIRTASSATGRSAGRPTAWQRRAPVPVTPGNRTVDPRCCESAARREGLTANGPAPTPLRGCDREGTAFTDEGRRSGRTAAAEADGPGNVQGLLCIPCPSSRSVMRF